MILILLDWNLRGLQIIFAIGLVTILPGYSLTTAIFIKHPLSLVEKIAFSAGLSLALAAVGGLFLHFTPWGLQTASWTILLGGVTLVANGLALARMTQTDNIDLSVSQISVSLPQLLLMLCAGLIITGAYLTARAGAENRPVVPPYTQLWIRWLDDGQAEIEIGLHNHEGTAVAYELHLSTQQGQNETWSQITLPANTTWTTRYPAPDAVADIDIIRATLYRLDAPDTPYRTVYLRRGNNQ
jgi:hypothetical protein